MEQLPLFKENIKLVNLKEASEWSTKYLNRKVTVSNISYLIQYGKIKKYVNNKKVYINLDELKNYYNNSLIENNKINIDNINWHLSFVEYKESERTKHVHRLHPYKGKFIPQLVEYFLDSHIDDFKKEIYFKPGDIVLDPFCGSGTTLVQANELGIHSIGIDISYFNVLISNVKVQKHNLEKIKNIIYELNLKLKDFQKHKNHLQFEEELSKILTEFNNKYFPSPEFKRKVREKIINEKEYAKEKVKEFLKIYQTFIHRYNIKIRQDKQETFLDKWFIHPVREEIHYLAELIKNIKDEEVNNLLKIILSRTVRSCRATTHSDLATLKEPVFEPYFCTKHNKICKPIFSIQKWWEYYTKDTIKRISEFEKIRTPTLQVALVGDSRNIDIYKELRKYNPSLAKHLKQKKIKGIFSSPPYVGLIDYHEQHAYAYELFEIKRNDDLEIGPLYKGQGEAQRKSYVEGISQVLLNCKKYLQKDYDIFLVANDKFNLYPKIAELSGMKIVQTFHRPVLNRVEKNREKLYMESIFHLKEK